MTYSFGLHHVIGTDNFPALIEFARDKNGMQFIEAVDASHNNWYPDTHSLRNWFINLSLAVQEMEKQQSALFDWTCLM